MRKYLTLLLHLLPFAAYASGDMIVYPNGMGKPGVYVPGFRTYSTNWYSTSSQNVAVLKEMRQSIPPIRIAGFGAASPGKTTLVCRLSFPVYLPGKMAHEVFLAEAMQAELLEAGLYSENAPVAVNGHLVSMDFNSFGTGKWKIEAKFEVEGKEPVTIKYEYTYPISMTAVNACGDVSRALVPALQGFLLTVYSDTGFKALLQPTVNPVLNADRSPAEPAGSPPAVGF